jgi:hypothetical protein
MKRIVAVLVVVAGLLVLPRDTGFADPVMPFKPGSVKEQQNEVPGTDTPLETILERLESEETDLKEGALLWLLRRSKATELSYFAFPKHSVRFGVDRVIKKETDAILWRLVECRYVSRQAVRSAAEYRAVWKVAYLFDDLGHLRDWIQDYDLLVLEDFNLDKKIDILAYIDSPKRVMILSYDRGRSRELLNVDDVPSHGREISRTPAEHGGEYVKYAPAAEVVGGADKKPKAIRIVEHGTYIWNAKRNKYLHTAQPENPPDKK